MHLPNLDTHSQSSVNGNDLNLVDDHPLNSKRGGSSGGGGGRGGGGGSSGGGRGSGGSGGGRGGGGSSGGSSGGRGGGGGSRGGGTTVPGGFGKGSSSSTTTSGGGAPRTIPGGMPFTGRSYGGGTRSNIWGDRYYGSGYAGAGYAGARGNVAGRNFGYGYWPVYWGPTYHGDDEYGPRDNGSRPGGIQATAVFSPTALTNATTLSPTWPPQYALVGDTRSVEIIMSHITGYCNGILVSNSTNPPNPSNNTLLPEVKDDYALQYYRESSFVLASFIQNTTTNTTSPTNNNTALTPWGDASSASPFIWPSDTLNPSFQDCVNSTIASNLPIQNSASSFIKRSQRSTTELGMLALVVAVGLTGARKIGLAGEHGLLVMVVALAMLLSHA